jgi:hypothetical protein
MLININVGRSQIFQSIMILQGTGTDFIPANPIELITTYTDLPTLISCYIKCNMDPLCRTFVSNITWPFVCRLYQGSIDTGTVVATYSPTSQVAGLRYDASLYGVYNQGCDLNLPPLDRYLICINGSWNCPTGTYWNGSMCINQVYYESSCNANKTCRDDIGLICSSICVKCLYQWSTIPLDGSCGKHKCISEELKYIFYLSFINMSKYITN